MGNELAHKLAVGAMSANPTEHGTLVPQQIGLPVYGQHTVRKQRKADRKTAMRERIPQIRAPVLPQTGNVFLNEGQTASSDHLRCEWYDKVPKKYPKDQKLPDRPPARCSPCGSWFLWFGPRFFSEYIDSFVASMLNVLQFINSYSIADIVKAERAEKCNANEVALGAKKKKNVGLWPGF